MTLHEVPDGATQLATANFNTLTLVMIERSRALDALDDVLAIAGVDGVFVGPADLSVTVSAGTQISPNAALVDEPIQHIATRAKAVSKIAGHLRAQWSACTPVP